jgi:hypothetical protein
MSIRYFDAGGATGATETTVSNWAAPVVAGVIQRGLEIAGQPYQTYGGAQVAGASDLQKNAFTGIQGLTQPNTSQSNAATNMQNVYQSAATQPGYAGTDFTKAGNASTQPAYVGTTFTSNTTGINNQFDQNALNSYMNPYLSTILNPQLEEARRQSQITQMQNDARMTQAGAFGGGRQAILNAETQRNLGTNLSDITGKGYQNAYTQALGQYNSDQNRLLDALKAKEQSGQYSYSKDAERLAADRTALLESLKAGEQSKQFGSKQGLDYLRLAGDTAQNQGQFGNQQQQLGLAANKQEAELGATQRGITQEGLTSDYNTWKEQRDYPKAQLDYFNNLIKQYPMTTTNTYGQAGNTAASTLGGLITALSAYDILSGKKTPP